MSWWLGSLTVRIRIYPLQNFLPTESRSTDQLSAPEIILFEGHQLLQLSGMFSVAVVGAEEIDVQSARSAWLPTHRATGPPGKSVDWINHYALRKDLEKERFYGTTAILGRIIRMIS